MDPLTQILFGYVAGLVLSGSATTILELVYERQLSFAPPFFSRERRWTFVLAMLISGPFMLLGDALVARRSEHIGTFGLVFAFVSASIWVWALGQFATDVAHRIAENAG